MVEDGELTGLKGIRAYTDLVKNKGSINVFGGQGNTGMFLKVRDNDDISNVAGGTISVSGLALAALVGIVLNKVLPEDK